MIPTGINGLDDMLGDGIPEGSKMVYSMEAGVNGQLFMLSTLASALAKKLSCLVILPYTTVDSFRRDAMATRSGSIDLCSKNLTYIDAIDRERIQKSTRSADTAQKEWRAKVAKICRDKQVDVIFVYIDLLCEDFGIEQALDIFEEENDEPKRTLIVEYLNLEGETQLDRFIHDFAFDVVISIKSSFPPMASFDYFTLVHTSWSPLPARSVPFIITEGRIAPYIPRIVVTGPAKAGKSTFITTASHDGLSVDRFGLDNDSTTVAMDFGLLDWKGFYITLYGTPGQPRFDLMIPGMFKHAMGVILIVDATKPESLPRAKQMIGLITERNMPMIIAANKKDLPSRLSEAEIRTALEIRKDIRVVFLSAKKKAEVKRMLRSFVDFITQFPY
ncbi:MAG: GTP-binding protein [Methanoregula sp.]